MLYLQTITSIFILKNPFVKPLFAAGRWYVLETQVHNKFTNSEESEVQFGLACGTWCPIELVLYLFYSFFILWARNNLSLPSEDKSQLRYKDDSLSVAKRTHHQGRAVSGPFVSGLLTKRKRLCPWWSWGAGRGTVFQTWEPLWHHSQGLGRQSRMRVGQ